MQGEQFFIEDLGSANGTLVNGVTIAAKTELHFGDRVQAGSTILVFTRHDELEARMRQMQRLEAMAALAGGLAHDFNNMLTIILGGLDELDYRFAKESDDRVRETFEGMRSAVTAGAVLARRLLNLGRTEPVALDRLDLAVVIEKTLAMAHQLVGSRIRLSAKVRPDVIVRGCQDELQQVLLNLVMNARDAMPDGGRLTIAVQLVHFDHSNALIRHLPNEGNYVELAITDTGIGMDEATLARAFEPFFTTKGQGTGLGLATIHAIVRRHGGTVLAESIPNQGTTFRVLLPKAT
jgi:signal transduction histidine kinase